MDLQWNLRSSTNLYQQNYQQPACLARRDVEAGLYDVRKVGLMAAFRDQPHHQAVEHEEYIRPHLANDPIASVRRSAAQDLKVTPPCRAGLYSVSCCS